YTALAQTGRLAHRRRVHADDRGAVSERVDEVVARLLGDRIGAFGRPDGDVVVPEVPRAIAHVRMRPDDHVQLAEAWVVARPQRGDPALDELRLFVVRDVPARA